MIKKTPYHYFLILLLSFLCRFSFVSASEGMWVPVLLDHLNFEEMQAKGFKLTPEDIYNINQACLTDAIVIFDGGCTGSIISDRGLLLTNHHCGYSHLQSHSTLENDLLHNGFWATKQEEELPNPDLSVKFLRHISDVTPIINKATESTLTQSERSKQIGAVLDSLTRAVEDTTDMLVNIEAFYYGNTWLLFLYEEYSDVRLVGAPPESLGKFGGDTDNWMWPRHNPDFSLFRVYMSPGGRPATFNKENIPLSPVKWLNISTKGIQTGDFTMVLGFPGRTYQYLHSSHLKDVAEFELSPRVEILEGKLEILERAMNEDELVALQYASKHARISNVWKKYIGVLYGFERADVFDTKANEETDLLNYMQNGPDKQRLKELYGGIETISDRQAYYREARRYFLETVQGIESLRFMGSVREVLASSPEDKRGEKQQELTELSDDFFRNYNPELDQKLAEYLLTTYLEGLESNFHPGNLADFVNRKNKDVSDYVERIYKKSAFVDKQEFNNIIPELVQGGMSELESDRLFELYSDFLGIYFGEILKNYNPLDDKLDSLYHSYMPLLLKHDTTHHFYPDANFTFRITYGNVEGYSPRDAVYYLPQTYVSGVLEKNQTGVKDYFLKPEIIAELNSAPKSEYAESTGMPACFLASNHTSGGNSGSPVLNAMGELIGLNFDRSWESTVGDYYYDQSFCRNISVDIRYILFVIEEIGKQPYLIDEMDISE